MKNSTRLAAIAVTALAGVGAVAGAASAQSDDGATPTGDRGQFVCAHADEIQQLQADHAELITRRLTLLGTARAEAEAAGDTAAVARIDERIEATTERQTRVAERQEQTTAYVAEHC